MVDPQLEREVTTPPCCGRDTVAVVKLIARFAKIAMVAEKEMMLAGLECDDPGEGCDVD